MISIAIIIGLIELGATYAIFYSCKKNVSYEKFMLQAKKENSEECMYKVFSYFDKIKELHELALDEEYTIEEINGILNVYIDLIDKYQTPSISKYTMYHTDKENKILYQILSAEYKSVIKPGIHYIRSKYDNHIN